METIAVLPASFSPSRKGYNSYLLALGVDPKDQKQVLFNAIPFAQFKTLDRETIQDKIDYAREMAHKMYNEYYAAKCAGLTATMEMAEGRWTYFANQWNTLSKQKNG